MHFSQPRLHAPLPLTEEQKQLAIQQVSQLALERQEQAMPQPGGEMISIPLTTVTTEGNYDAHIHIRFQGSLLSTNTRLTFDSGNSMLIVPYWEHIENLPGYTDLGDSPEPWGCPAKVVRGPILIPGSNGEVFTINDCFFYACTADNPNGGGRTGNFGAGCINPWSANWGNVPFSQPGSLIMQAPLSYNTQYPFAEIIFRPAFADDGSVMVSDSSTLNLYRIQPPGYLMMTVSPNLEWMSLIPKSLGIDGKITGWPGTVKSPIAMIDSGGGPVLLSDPDGYIYNKQWAGRVGCPSWANTSLNCYCISAQLTVELTDGVNSYAYTIDTSKLPASVQGVTLVPCERNHYMRGEQGMNIGGVSFLFNDILINYGANLVGFRSKTPVN